LQLPQEFITRSEKLLGDPDVKNEVRNRLLEARWKKEISETSHIPMFDDEINEEMFGLLGDSKKLESAEDLARMVGPLRTSISAKTTDILVPSNVTAVSNTANSKTHIQPPKLRFIKQIRAHQLLSKARRNRPKVVQDYVSEEKLPKRDPRNSFLGLFPYPDIFRVIRPLKPRRIDTASNLAQHGALIGSGDSGCKISIQVLRGFNIPVRSTGIGRKSKIPIGPVKDTNAPVCILI
jgi:hypothetical protein